MAALDGESLYRKFTETKQEPLRLAAALEGFFREPPPEEARRLAYGAYLKRRVRPAAAALIGAEDVEKLARLEALGWLDRHLVDELIRNARERRKPASLVWLLRLKREKYGFQDRDFSL